MLGMGFHDYWVDEDETVEEFVAIGRGQGSERAIREKISSDSRVWRIVATSRTPFCHIPCTPTERMPYSDHMPPVQAHRSSCCRLRCRDTREVRRECAIGWLRWDVVQKEIQDIASIVAPAVYQVG